MSRYDRDAKKYQAMWKDLAPAMSDIDTTLENYTTNEPISRREGNIAQANLERTHIKSISRLKEKIAEVI